MKGTMKHEIGSLRRFRLDLNVHNNVYIDEGFAHIFHVMALGRVAHLRRTSQFIDLLEKYLPRIFQKFSLEQSEKIFLPRRQCCPTSVVYDARISEEKKVLIEIELVHCRLQLNIENTDDLKTVWIDIIEKLFVSLPRCDQSKRFLSKEILEEKSGRRIL